jgi:hypothetical protein
MATPQGGDGQAGNFVWTRLYQYRLIYDNAQRARLIRGAGRRRVGEKSADSSLALECKIIKIRGLQSATWDASRPRSSEGCLSRFTIHGGA